MEGQTIIATHMGIIEFDNPLYCQGEVLGKAFLTTIDDVLLVFEFPRYTKPSDSSKIEKLDSPKSVSHHNFKYNWGEIHMTPSNNSAVNALAFYLKLPNKTEIEPFSFLEDYKNKIQNIFFLESRYITSKQEVGSMKRKITGGAHYYDGIILFKDIPEGLLEMHNPHGITIKIDSIDIVPKEAFLSIDKIQNAFDTASLKSEISKTYYLYIIACKLFFQNDYRSAVVLAGSALENCILNKTVSFCQQNQIELKIPIGELGKKFSKLKELKIKIPIENYKEKILNVRNDVVHKGKAIERMDCHSFLSNCRIIIDEYEPNYLNIDVEQKSI